MYEVGRLGLLPSLATLVLPRLPKIKLPEPTTHVEPLLLSHIAPHAKISKFVEDERLFYVLSGPKSYVDYDRSWGFRGFVSLRSTHCTNSNRRKAVACVHRYRDHPVKLPSCDFNNCNDEPFCHLEKDHCFEHFYKGGSRAIEANC